MTEFAPRGNEKLGNEVVVYNRPVGDSCPPDCPFLHDGCYAEATEKRFKASRELALRNFKNTDADGIERMIRFAIKHNRAIRGHERGDFLRDGKLDMVYIRAWKTALKRFNREDLPDIWFYTHALYKTLANLEKYGVRMYASVHNEEQAAKAKALGFKHIAYITDMRKKKGGSYDAPKYVELPVVGRTLVCPEQRMGRKRVTCDTCKWCLNGGENNVAFLTH